MQRSTMPLAFIFAALLALFVAAPAGAATTGTICGQITAFAAPTGTEDGTITIDGTEETIAAGTVITDAVSITALAEADATACLEIVAEDEVIVALSLATRICGDVTFDATADLYAVAGVLLTEDVVTADADLAALLDAAIATDAEVCLDVTYDTATGLIASAMLDATLTLCGDATLDADSVTIGGVDVPLSLLDAEAQAILALAAEAEAEVCLEVVVTDTEITEANLSADILLCGEVTLDADGNAVVNGVTIDADLLTAGGEALLALAASADGEACATIVAVTSNGDTLVTVSVTIEVCAEVTAIGDGTITLDGVTLGFAGAADSEIEVGDTVCLVATTGPTGEPVVTEIEVVGAEPTPTPTPTPAPDDDEGTADDDDDVSLPDTSTGRTGDLVALGIGMLAAAFVGGAAIRRFEGRVAR